MVKQRLLDEVSFLDAASFLVAVHHFLGAPGDNR